MPKAIRIYDTGGPEVLKWEDFDPGEPGMGQVRIANSAIGVNFIDIYHRTGLYPAILPGGIGVEACGVVEAVGPEVSEFSVGDRVAYGAAPLGSYSEVHVMPEHRLVRVPDEIDDRTAATLMLKGMTAWYLLRRTYPVQAGETILIHAAAGAVGLIAVQWAKHLGATVIGTVGSEDKAELARAHGCDHTILYRDDDFARRVREITGGEGVPVVYDSVGKATFGGSLDCLRPLGMMVSFGNASGPVPDMSPALLAQKGSLFLTRPTLMHYNDKREDLLAGAAEVFEVVRSGAVRIRVNQTYPLADAAQAHADLAARRTTGCTVLLP